MKPQDCAVSVSNIITFTAADRQAYLRSGCKNADARYLARIVKVAQRVMPNSWERKKNAVHGAPHKAGQKRNAAWPKVEGYS